MKKYFVLSALFVALFVSSITYAQYPYPVLQQDRQMFCPGATPNMQSVVAPMWTPIVNGCPNYVNYWYIQYFYGGYSQYQAMPYYLVGTSYDMYSNMQICTYASNYYPGFSFNCYGL